MGETLCSLSSYTLAPRRKRSADYLAYRWVYDPTFNRDYSNHHELTCPILHADSTLADVFGEKGVDFGMITEEVEISEGGLR